MKLITMGELMLLPENVLWSSESGDDLNRKGETLFREDGTPLDFWYEPLSGGFDGMKGDYALSEGECRYGAPDPANKVLVWEADDVLKAREFILSVIPWEPSGAEEK